MSPLPRSLPGLVALALLAAGAPAPGSAQQPGQPVHGTVYDEDRRPVGGADVLLGPSHRTSTDDQGRFRLAGVPEGTHIMVVRMIGFRPSRSRVPVSAGEPTEVDIYLMRDGQELPVLVVEGRRTGIYGVIGDTAFRPALGATVEALGPRGGTTRTDSLGRFAFPNAGGGDYLVRITLPGYVERRFAVTLEKGAGREVTALLTPAPPRYRGTPRREEWALDGLRDRLVWMTSRHRLTREELVRYGSLPLCELAMIRGVTGDAPTVIVNGDVILRGWTFCAWRADEIELVEWGENGCADRSGSITRITGDACTRRNRGPGFLVLWERR